MMGDNDALPDIESVGEDFFADPYASYARWRERGPVHRVRLQRNGLVVWVIIGYEEGRAALTDPRLLKNPQGMTELFRRKNLAVMTDGFDFSGHMLNADPPDHTRLRKLVTKAFTARRVAALRPRIEEITEELLDAMDGHDEVDLLHAFAVPLPVTVICELLGVPIQDRDRFQRWTRVLTGGTRGGDTEILTAGTDMSKYLHALVRAKQEQPEDDLLSALVHAGRHDHAEDDTTSRGQDPTTPHWLSEQELVSMAFLLLVAGHETTVNLIANGTRALLHNPSQLRALRADLSAVPSAVEEFLRYDGPAGWSTYRFTDEPIQIGGTEIPAGEFVRIALAATNRDPSRFTDPETLDLTGDPNGHLGFGHGIHYCVGAPLARLEADIAFRGLLRRFPALALPAHAESPIWQSSMLIRGMTEFPVRLR
ncbi:cytochrome P450 family protein [Nocardia takedensis]